MIRIIPAIDIIEGKAVRLSGGDFAQVTIYNNDPVEVAREFADAGIRRLHMVDLEGARSGQVKNWKTLEKVAVRSNLQIDFGGGIQSQEDVQRAFNAGAMQVNSGTIPAKEKDEFLTWLKKFGADKFLIGADVRNDEILVKGWEENSGIKLDDFISGYLAEGVAEFFCTDVSKDGMMQGPSVELYTRLLKEFTALSLIASGGVRNIRDVEELDRCGCSAVIIGKAIYEGKIKLKELEVYAN
jgi:phosphoribosylformimino-5-aminoimidazole carboxamide ribotide isomerase